MITQANIVNYMDPFVEQLKITNQNNYEHFKSIILKILLLYAKKILFNVFSYIF